MQSNQSTIFSKIRFRTAKTNEPDHMRYIANSRHNPDKYKRSEDAEHLIYAATRPRAAGGLFGPNGPEELKQSMAEIEARQNPLSWRIICSLREDDAQRLGYVSPAAWQDLTKRIVAQFARATKIAPQNLCWRAGHHNEPGHPHVHVILWLKDGAPTRRGKLSAEELREFRRGQAREIFGPLRVRLAAEKTEARNTMLSAVRGNVTEVERLVRFAELEMQIQDPVGIRLAPGFSSQDLDTLASKISALAAIMPGKGQVKLAFMPPDVKEEVKRIADWFMARPELKEARASYETASVQLAKIYTADPKKLREAEQNARDDLRNRIAQLVLKGAVDLQKVENSIEQKPEMADYETAGSSRTEKEKGLRDSSGTLSNFGSERGKSFSRDDKTAEKLWRSTCFSLGREYRNLNLSSEILKPQLGHDLRNELVNRLHTIAKDMPDQKGKPAYAYLPDNLKKQAREMAEWLLNRPELQNRFNELENKESLINRMSEQVVSRSYELLPRELPERINFVIHEGRSATAIMKLTDANANLIKDDYEEAIWTAGTIYRAMTYLNNDKDKAWEAAEKFASRAGLSEKDFLDAISREINRMEYIKENDFPIIVGRDDWQRLTENLGLREEELLRPWFGVKEKNESEKEADQKLREELGVTLLEERIPDVVAAFENSCFHSKDSGELRWTIITMAATLKAINIDAPERARIVSNWCRRSGVEITPGKLRNVLDRTTISDTDIWLGKKSWARLMTNLGIEEGKAPEGPWRVGRSIPLSSRIATGVYKSVWKALERERLKAQAQAELASLRETERAESRNNEHNGRER